MKIVHVLLSALIIASAPPGASLARAASNSDSNSNSISNGGGEEKKHNDSPQSLAVAPHSANPLRKLQKAARWALATAERLYDGGVPVSDLISSFLIGCDGAIHRITGGAGAVTVASAAWFTAVVGDRYSTSYTDLRDREFTRLKDFDEEFAHLSTMRKNIQIRCLKPSRWDDLSSCKERETDVTAKITDLRTRREKAAAALESYEGWIDWCNTYNNWLC